MKRITLIIGWSLIILQSNIIVRAQDALNVLNVADLSIEELMNIKVYSTSKIEENMTESPASIYVITKQDIKLRGYQDLKDILRDIPSFDYIANGGERSITAFSTRGVFEGTSNMLVFKDGIKVSNPGNINLPFGNQMPLHDVERIEVVVGPSSVVYGQDTYSGLINIFTDHKVKNEIQVGVGSFSTYSLSGFVNLPIKKGYVFLSGRGYFSKGFSSYNQYPEQYKEAVDAWKTKIPDWQDKFDENDMKTNAFKKDYNFHFEINRGKLKIGVIHSRITEAKVGFSPERYLTNHNTSIDIKATQFYSIYQDTISRGLISKTQFLFNHHQTGDDYKNTYVIPQELGGVTLPAGVEKYFYYLNSSSSLQQQFIYSPIPKILLNAGVIAEHISSVPLTENYFEPKNLSEELGTYAYNNMGGFLQGTYSFNSKYKFIMGGRVDHNSNYGLVPVYRFAFLLNPSSKINLKALYGKAYREPTVRQLHTVNITDVVANVGNPSLSPETIQTGELGFLYKISKKLLFGTNVYHNHSDDIIVQKPIGTDSNGRTIMQNQNVNSLTTYGTEISLKYQIIKELTVDLWYAYLDGNSSEYDQNTNNFIKSEITQISHNKANLGISYTLLKKIGFYLNTHWVDKISTTKTNSEFMGVPMDGYVNLDLNISYLGSKVEAGLMVNNLLNQKYYHAGPTTQTGTYISKTPQPLQNCFLKLIYHF